MNLADLYSALGDRQRAEPLYERVAAIQEAVLGTEHLEVAVTLNHQADLHRVHGEYELAEPLYLRALAIQEAAEHPSIAITLADLGDLYTRQGRYQEAEERYLHSLMSIEASSRLGRSRTAATRVGLGELYLAMGDTDEAVESWTRAVAVIAPLSAGSDVVEYLDTHAQALLYLGRVDEARPLAAKLLAKGWSDPDFLQLCREHGLSDREEPFLSQGGKGAPETGWFAEA